MPSYPDLTACGIYYMHFTFHVAGGLEAIDAFWESRGLDRSRERHLVREMDVPFGIRARYAYPWDKEMESVPRPPHARLKSVSFDILDEKQRPAINLTYERQDSRWIAVVEPVERFPFPDDKSFFFATLQVGLLARQDDKAGDKRWAT